MSEDFVRVDRANRVESLTLFNYLVLSISPEQSHRREDEDLLRRAAGDVEEELQLQGALLDPGAIGSYTEQIRQRARPSERLEVGEVHRDLQGEAPQEDSHRPGEDYRGWLLRHQRRDVERRAAEAGREGRIQRVQPGPGGEGAQDGGGRDTIGGSGRG